MGCIIIVVKLHNIYGPEECFVDTGPQILPHDSSGLTLAACCTNLHRLTLNMYVLFLLYIFSTFLYMKFLMVWALVLMADFILEFRFEYLWPFWLLMRSVYDSFKFQGLVSKNLFAI